MTGQQHITKFINMVEDELDQDYTLQLLNDAKNEVEAMHDWEILKATTTYTTTASTNYQNALGTLPTDFAEQLSVTDSSDFQYDKINFQDENGKRNSVYGYFLDLANNNIYLTGENVASTTVTLAYKKTSDDIELATSWVFPTRFHSILNYKMAEIYYASDAGEKGRAWDDRWSAQFERAYSRAATWDARLKTVNASPARTARFDPKGIQAVRYR